MTELIGQKEANKLRQSGKFDEALLIYKQLWEQGGDKFDGSGYLHCLRNLRKLEEATVLADNLITKYANFDWCRNEVIWTFIQGRLNKLTDQEPLENVKSLAIRIMVIVIIRQ